MWLCEWKDEHLFSRTSIICSVREGSKVVISIRTRAKTCCGVISRDTHSFQLAQHGHRSPEQIQMSQNFDPSNLPWPKPVSESSRPDQTLLWLVDLHPLQPTVLLPPWVIQTQVRMPRRLLILEHQLGAIFRQNVFLPLSFSPAMVKRSQLPSTAL